jgi:hypothetical protein
LVTRYLMWQNGILRSRGCFFFLFFFCLFVCLFVCVKMHGVLEAGSASVVG